MTVYRYVYVQFSMILVVSSGAICRVLYVLFGDTITQIQPSYDTFLNRYFVGASHITSRKTLARLTLVYCYTTPFLCCLDGSEYAGVPWNIT